MEGNSLKSPNYGTYISSTDRKANIEILRLRSELKRIAEQQDFSPHTSIPSIPGPEVLYPGVSSDCSLVADGSGCASAEIYQDMLRTNWYGRLGRAHMVDVDSLTPTRLAELDAFLWHTIGKLLPRTDTRMTGLRKDTVFGGLKDLGIRLEDRTAFADVDIFDDANNAQTSTASRMRNWAADFYSRDHKSWSAYWSGFALETLLELARYRGLIGSDGMLREESVSVETRLPNWDKQ